MLFGNVMFKRDCHLFKDYSRQNQAPEICFRGQTPRMFSLIQSARWFQERLHSMERHRIYVPLRLVVIDVRTFFDSTCQFLKNGGSGGGSCQDLLGTSVVLPSVYFHLSLFSSPPSHSHKIKSTTGVDNRHFLRLRTRCREPQTPHADRSAAWKR